MSQLNIFHYIVAFGVVVGFIRYSNLIRVLKTLPFFLLLTLLAEIATPLKLIRFHGNNAWFFNLFTTFEFLYYCFIFYSILESYSQKKILLFSGVAFFILAGVNIFFIQGFYKFHTISYRLGAVMIIVWCFLYFRQLLRSSEYIVLLRNPYFWISTGLLFFYLGFFFYFSAFDYIVYKKISFNRELWIVISNILNILLYSCFLIALICQRKNLR